MPKEKTEKRLEELLEAALVKEEEQSYQVPGNWVWVKLGLVCKVKNGFAFKNDDYCENGISIIRISDINNGFVTTEKAVKVPKHLYNKYFVIEKGDLLIGMSGATTGKSGIFESDEIVMQNQRVGNIKIINQNALFGGYRNYFIKNLANDILKIAYGGAQPNISASLIEKIFIPLPPLPEQIRIVQKLTSMLDKLKQARELIQEARDTFEERRAAVLHQAFTGKKKKKWREENLELVTISPNMYKINEEQLYEIPISWEWVKLIDISLFRSGGAFKSQDFIKDGIQVLRMGNIKTGELDLEKNAVFLPSDYDIEMINKYILRENDILITLTGTKYKRDYGNVVLMKIKNNEKILFNQRILCITPVNVNSKYLYYYFQSDFFRDIFFSQETGGVNQGNVSSKFVETIPTPIPTKKEQHEIVRILDSLLNHET
ncbi:MAG: restriction endonuclease subunit S, partial [Desulfobacterales bacterium]|nr:restriction endonuclease subunit S [Desulfobacterales bacterium]